MKPLYLGRRPLPDPSCKRLGALEAEAISASVAG